MRELVIFGGNRLHAGFAMKKQELGIDKIIVVDWNARPDFAGDLSVCCDIKDADAVWASSAIRWEQVMCVYTSADAGTASQAELHRRMGLLTPAQEALDNEARDADPVLYHRLESAPGSEISRSPRLRGIPN